jgi:peptide/nickel transport system substrate-binding protein
MRIRVAVVAMFIVLWGGLLPSSASAQQKTLVVGSNFLIKTLDPGRTIETTSHMVNHSVYDSLVTFDGEDLTAPKPSLATEWKISPDGKTYTFKIRPNVKFASGNPLTSIDFKWSLDRVKNIKGNPSVFLDSIEEIEAPDPSTLVLKLKAVTAGLLPILSNPSLGAVDSKLVLEKGGDASPQAKEKDRAESFLNGQSAGTGAYILSRYVPDQEVVLVKNSNHWRGMPKLDRIVIRNITEPATQKLQLSRGDLDIATGLDQDQVQALKGVQAVTVKASPAAVTFYVLMNTDPQIGGAFANPKVREALRYALDYDGIMALAGTGAVRLAGVIPTVFPGALDPKDAVKTDRDKAKALLREANLGEVKGAITYGSDQIIFGVQMALLAQKIQSDLAAVGMNISLNGLPRVAALQLYRDGKNQLGIWSWAADWPDGSNFLVYAPGRVVGKRAGWLAEANAESREIAQLAKDAETEVDLGKRTGVYHHFEQRLAQVGPYAPLFQPAVPYSFRSNVQGVTFHSVWGLDFWTISK